LAGEKWQTGLRKFFAALRVEGPPKAEDQVHKTERVFAASPARFASTFVIDRAHMSHKIAPKSLDFSNEWSVTVPHQWKTPCPNRTGVQRGDCCLSIEQALLQA
jgi:hypothetical protein